MQESWKNTNDLNESLGDDFDVAAGWEAFNKPKDKKRPIPFWFCGTLSVIGLAIIVCLCLTFHQKKTIVGHAISKSKSQLLNEGNLATKTSIPQQQKEKITLNTLANNRFLAPITKDISQKKNTKHQDPSIKNSNIFTKRSTPLNTSYNQQTSNIPTESAPINEYEFTNKNSSKIEVATEKNNQNHILALTLRSNSLDRLPTFLNLLVIKQKISTPEFNEFINPKTISIPFNKTWAFGLAYSYNRPKRTIQGNNEVYQNLRQNGEQFLEQQQIDFTLTRSFNRRFFLSTGLTYGRYRSRLVEKIQDLRSPIVYDNVIIETHTQNNITNEIKGTAIGSQLSINQSTRYQVYQILSIPLQLGIQVPLKRNWQLSLATGIALNLWQPTKGNTYASTLPDGKFTSVASLGYRSAGTIENISTFRIQKRISKQLSLQLGLQAKFDLNNRIKKEIGVSDKWKSYGLSIGINKHW